LPFVPFLLGLFDAPMIDPKDYENAIAGIRELVKQLITLSTGIIALTITFSKEFIAIENLTQPSKYLIGVSWMLFLISIVFGILALMAISGLNIQLIWGSRKIEEFEENPGTYPKDFKSSMLYFGAQVVFFLLALILIVVYGFQLI